VSIWARARKRPAGASFTLPTGEELVSRAEADGPLAGLALLDGLSLPGHGLPGVRDELQVRAGRTEDAVGR